MNGIFVTVLVFFALAAGLGVVAYFTYQKKLRRAKAIERGLKMVPILIHLPPPSSDTAGGSRDIREVMREKTAQAEVLYNLLAGTATEGFKSGFYGQRHLALELIVIDGLVHFFAVAPVALVGVVKKAALTAYPGARLEEVEDHNIFNQEGRLAATLGGEMVLRAESAYPIATYEQLERDPMEALLTTVSALEKQDGVAIQIMLRPAGASWTKKSVTLANSMRKGGHAGLGFSPADLAQAVMKAPAQRREEERLKTGGGPDVSQLALSQVERIEEKTKHPGFEVLVRVIVSTGSVARSQQLLRDIATTFALYEAPGLNGFKFLPAVDVQGLVTAFIFRFFPPELRGNVLSSAELATLFHLPDSQFTPSTSVGRQQSKQVDGPVQMPTVGLLFGYNEFRGVQKEIRLSAEDRRRHTYILGQTGTGKSTMLENLAVQDMLSGQGFAFIDPHGDSAEKLLSMVPKERAEDVIYFNPADSQYPLGLNLFEFTDPAQKDFIVQETINMLYKLYDPGHTGIIGPRYEHWYRNAALTLMSDPNGSTFIEIPKVFTDTEYLKRKFKYLKDPTVIDFWTKEMGQTSDYHKSEMLGWFVSKFGAFQNNEIMRNIVGQTKSAFSIRDVMDRKKILIVNLSKGRIGELNSQLLGMIFVIKFQAAAMSRADVPEEQRPDFALYVDEFQNFATDSFASILSEARKYRLNLIVANQFIGQLSNEIRDAVFGNIGTIVAHRMGPDDAEFMVKQFAPVFDAGDLVNIPNFNAAMRLMIGGLPSQPFSIHDSAPLGNANAELGLAIKQLSAAKYGHDKAVVEADILDRFSGGSVGAAVAAGVTPGAPGVAAAPVSATGVALTSAPSPGAVVAPSPVASIAAVQPVTSVAPAGMASMPPVIGAPAIGALPVDLPPAPQPVAVAQPVSAPVPGLADASHELAAQMVLADARPAVAAPVPLSASGGVVTPPPIGAPPVDLPGLLPAQSQAASVSSNPVNTLSLSDITGGKQPGSAVSPQFDLSDLPVLGSLGPQSGTDAVSMVGDGAPLAGDPYANIDIMGSPGPEMVADAQTSQMPVGDGTPLPNDPYSEIDVLGGPVSAGGAPMAAAEEPVGELWPAPMLNEPAAAPVAAVAPMVEPIPRVQQVESEAASARPAQEPVAAESFVHFVDPVAESLLNHPEAELKPASASVAASTSGLPAGVAFVSPEAGASGAPVVGQVGASATSNAALVQAMEPVTEHGDGLPVAAAPAPVPMVATVALPPVPATPPAVSPMAAGGSEELAEARAQIAAVQPVPLPVPAAAPAEPLATTTQPAAVVPASVVTQASEVAGSVGEVAPEPMSGADQIQKAEHEIDDLLSVSLIHPDNTPTHRRLPEAMPAIRSGDEPGADGGLNENRGTARERPAVHHGLKVIQPLEPIVPPKELFAKELAEMRREEVGAAPLDAGQAPASPVAAAPAPIQAVAAPVVVAPEPTVPEPAPMVMQAAAPAPAENFDEGLPPAQSLAATEVAKARGEQAAAEPATIVKHDAPRLSDGAPSEAAQGAAAPAPERKRQRGGREKPAEHIESEAEAEHNKPSQAGAETAALTGRLILPSAQKPAMELEQPKAEKPKNLAPGEVYVDETGNVVIGE